jgi:hypothetical protein
MAAWRSLGVAAILVLAPAGWAQNYPLAETPQAGDCFRLHIDMKLAGQIRVLRDSEVAPMKLEATAAHDFVERVLAVGKAGVPEKVARSYTAAKATFTVGDERSERALRPKHRLLVTQRFKDQFLSYCPGESLTRDELELTDHFDTLALTGLLPGKPVAVGETWKLPPAVVQALCHFDGLTTHDLTGKLEGVIGDTARLSVTGTASGIELGALVKLALDATCRYDLTARRLVGVEWRQRDERDQGPVSPASTVEMTATLTRTPVEQPAELSDVALVSVPDGFEPPAQLQQLAYEDPKGRFAMSHGREWHMVGRTDDHLILRLMERGDFIAQVTITPWPKAEPGTHASAEEFQEAMTNTPGWQPEQVLQGGEVPTDEKGRWVYRVSALGQMDGLKVMQNFYLVAGPAGDQVVLAFTLKPAYADKLGTRDLSLVGSIDLPTPKRPDKEKP